MELLYDLDDIEIVAKQFILDIDDYKIIAFTGDLGAGKTTFITAVCKELQVKEAITSPTYSIIQEYHFGKENIIYHMDLYRIKNIEEAMDAGVEECLQSGHLCFVEWPENAHSFFMENTVWVTLKTVSEFGRKMVVQLP
ncbi:MAG: tRNA (adenosine(37)-N6)-threonylcarbamoyltransferase complex ATPase subunit type 1 TsaE [Bacteroidota bacterium]|nr:tRNA (adenosine(37)-N6)-threonylcarbamoyltransferase complex ATPase subunit type 1 TsaE [Bacteroidota bacterium]